MEFGEQIRALRKREGLSQAQFASRLQVTRQAVSNWENNRNLPDLELLISMSRTFDVSLDELILGEEHRMREEKKEKETAQGVLPEAGTETSDPGQGAQTAEAQESGNALTRKLIRDGSEGRRALRDLISTLVGEGLLLFGLACFLIKAASVEYVDAQGVLHENFFLLPIGYLFLLAGMIVLASIGVRAICRALRERRERAQEVR